MKFKVGDKVRIIRELICTKIKRGSPLDDLDIKGFIITKIENGTIYRKDNKRYSQGDLELVPEEPEFEYGEEIEVSDDGEEWMRGIFLCKILGNDKYPYIIAPISKEEFDQGEEFTNYSHRYARKFHQKLTRKEIAQKLGVNEDFILVD